MNNWSDSFKSIVWVAGQHYTLPFDLHGLAKYYKQWGSTYRPSEEQLLLAMRAIVDTYYREQLGGEIWQNWLEFLQIKRLSPTKSELEEMVKRNPPPQRYFEENF